MPVQFAGHANNYVTQGATTASGATNAARPLSILYDPPEARKSQQRALALSVSDSSPTKGMQKQGHNGQAMRQSQQYQTIKQGGAGQSLLYNSINLPLHMTQANPYGQNQGLQRASQQHQSTLFSNNVP